MDAIPEVDDWKAELESVFARVAGRFARADLRWRMRDYVRGLLAPVGRKNGWQLAEWAGHRDPAGLQHLLNGARWDADAVRDDVRDYAAERLGPGGVLIIDDTGFIKKGTASAGVGRQYTGTSGACISISAFSGGVGGRVDHDCVSARCRVTGKV
ncbi:transposase, partial [Streptomyces hirsutus]